MNELHFDESYLRRLAERDPATEEHFVSYFSNRLSSALRKSNLIQAEIDSVKQETFLRVWAAVREGSIQHPQGFGSYVQAVCQRVLQESGHLRPIKSEENQNVGQELGLEEEMQRFQNGAMVRTVLEQLPERDRKIMRAHFFEERDSDDVCLEFGVDRDYLRVLFHRAIKKVWQGIQKKVPMNILPVGSSIESPQRSSKTSKEDIHGSENRLSESWSRSIRSDARP